jgi:indole-3-glycerol phosphate synthase
VNVPEGTVSPSRFLPQLMDAARARAAEVADTPALWAAARAAGEPLDFRAAVHGGGARPIAIIAECKARSPSAGRLVAQYDPAAQAAAYRAAGAAAVSVLTEPRFFDGHLEHLAAVRGRVDLPVLRKDFLLAPQQVAEARAHGADAVLAIVRILTDDELRRLLAAAEDLHMAVLVEVHSRRELDRALDAGAALVGVNNRDLDTFETRIDRALDLASALPSRVTAVAESGIRTPDDLARLAGAGYHAALIGQTLMQEGAQWLHRRS